MSARLLAALAVLAAAAAATPAAASSCEEMWFVRNLVFDRAGMCFTSPLGAAVFDNSDCRAAGAAPLSARSAEIVAQIKGFEADLGCAVETSQTGFELPTEAALRAAEELPVPSLGESLCLGFNAPTVPLRAAPRLEAEVISSVTAGDAVGFGYEPVTGWDYVVTARGGGWMPRDTIPPESCEGWAG